MRGLVLDKDGTLIDFHASWDPVFASVLQRLAGSDAGLLQRMADVVDFDLRSGQVRPTSPVISESNAGFADRLAPLSGRRAGDREFLAEIEGHIESMAAAAAREVAGASEVLSSLARRGVPLGLATNDSEAAARRQVEHLGWAAHFRVIVGYDSGHGAKPGPGMVHACAAAMGLAATEVAMVGDSRHDLEAARGAGAVAVLVGDRTDLVGHADLVIDTLAELDAIVEP